MVQNAHFLEKIGAVFPFHAKDRNSMSRQNTRLARRDDLRAFQKREFAEIAKQFDENFLKC